jgi:hypothetical protein
MTLEKGRHFRCEANHPASSTTYFRFARRKSLAEELSRGDFLIDKHKAIPD